MHSLKSAVYGHIAPELALVPPGPTQCSPLVPPLAAGSASLDLADVPPGTLDQVSVHAPPGTLERRRVLALALQALTKGGTLIALAANGKGGTRLVDELAAFGCAGGSTSKRHHRIVVATRPEAPVGLDAAIKAGAARYVDGIGMWSEPGVFSWDRIDPGSGLLMAHLPALAGRGADLGSGIGVLGRAVASGGACRHLTLIDIDRRALAQAGRNVPSRQGLEVATLWRDVRTARDMPTGLDFIVMNPPFHDGGEEDRTLGSAFIAKAAQLLRPGGTLWMTANRHLPYEATLSGLFESFDQIADSAGFKILTARKGASKPRRPKRATTEDLDTIADPAAVLLRERPTKTAKRRQPARGKPRR